MRRAGSLWIAVIGLMTGVFAGSIIAIVFSLGSASRLILIATVDGLGLAVLLVALAINYKGE
ncbi:MAG TPA: hypothetical protein VG845_02005 [Dehalococcoidia bacterium]|jgi:hypothetical protein|nr:hypothetical protein [Dehalococcoidia bacterium]